MKSLRLRIALWFGVSFLVLTGAFVVVSYRLLDSELRKKHWQQDYPDHPDWRLHGSFSQAEVRDIIGELTEATLGGVLPLVVVAGFLGYWLARKSLRPIANVNAQLQTKTATNLDEPISLPEMDVEFRDLVSHLNDLLTRLNHSFKEMNDYAAKVSHELRTPLAILRLKIEQAEGRIHPELSDELQNELARLTHLVDQSLLIARAQQGQVVVHPRPIDLVAVVTDIVQDFRILAQEHGRQLVFTGPPHRRIIADEPHLRQIIHNLLTNAFKHGEGELRVRVKDKGAGSSLLLVNRVAPAQAASAAALGIGLRVVAALLSLEGGIRFQRRRSARIYAVRLVFSAPVPPVSSQGPPPPALARPHAHRLDPHGIAP
jgi:signal transduction histidine kinase